LAQKIVDFVTTISAWEEVEEEQSLYSICLVF
jgi:hypothetical protein